ncbi:hypothetical protein CHLNCDRAFT_143757 [Chlorella variabilis]|uniref:inositol-1,3,4-trisphosphate 5/6-kinase n=1 Tax=Chlorella variabilis TaxID=554065 RepID=E1ZAD8_CHLVA|nr:hypothetical protein CHLNCDRAFT_143757 [Chlorella variabilis]EFN57042.1 hypothetical protein CHLNCDRAFT_143757 [Chlorella variabilis]|eukprot:XP_005849144.1 hypothetical protein CHLNCDRAFT_143757 [Chlorella variabilis]
MDATLNDLEALAASLASPASSPRGEHELGRLAEAFLDRSDGAELGVGGGSQALGSKIREVAQALKALDARLQHIAAATCDASVLDAVVAAGCTTRSNAPLLARLRAPPSKKYLGFCLGGSREQGHGVPSPPAWLLQALAQRLRRQTGLSLFNFDVIVPMHCHRRRLRHDSSTAGVGTPASSLEQARMQQAGQAGQQAGGVQQNGACRPQQAEQAEEPAALDLRLAEAQAAAAAAAAPAVLHDAAARGGACVGQERRPPSEHAGHAGQGEEGQQQELLYHLIDINYFPVYEKMPNYEGYMVQFLRSITAPREAAAAAAAPSPNAQQEQEQQQQADLPAQ